MRDGKYRQKVAALARRVRAGKMDFFAFLDAVGPPDDPYRTGDEDVDQLIDLFEHEPATGRKWWFFGTSPEQHAAYMSQIDALIGKLES